MLAAELEAYRHARHRTRRRAICYRPRVSAVFTRLRSHRFPTAPLFGLSLAVALALSLGLPAEAAARVKRGNTILERSLRKPALGVSAAARMGVLVGNGGVFIQPPLGYGFGFDLRYHALSLGFGRLGLQFTAGHTRFQDRALYSYVDEAGETREVTRFTTLGHTDITLGPSLQIPAGVLFIEGGVSGGVAVSVFRWPHNHLETDDTEVVGYEPMLRTDLALAVPIRNNQGIRLGADFIKIWSPEKNWVISDFDPETTPVDTQPDTAVFDLYLDVVLAYQAWF